MKVSLLVQNVNWIRYAEKNMKPYVRNVMLSQVRYAACNWRGQDDDMMHHSDLSNKIDRFTLNEYGIFDTDNRINNRGHSE